MIGIIYKYTAPNGKIYIGQTLNEERRRKEFFTQKKYSGFKFNNAIKKYKPENFEYEVLYKKEYNNQEEAFIDLNEQEIKYIKQYNSIENGYNISTGGMSINHVMNNEETKQRMINSLKEHYKTHGAAFQGKKHTEETKEKLRQIALGRPSAMKGKKYTEEEKSKFKITIGHNNSGKNNPFYGKTHTEETKQKIKEKNSKSVVQIDKDTNEIIQIFPSGKAAADFLGKPHGNSEIFNACKNKVRYQNGKPHNHQTAYGYKWKYLTDIESSTTIEKNGKKFLLTE